MRRIVQGLILFAFLVLFAAVACVAVIFITTGNDPLTAARNGIAGLRVSLMQDELNTPAGNSAEPVRFVVVPGMSTGQIAEGLFANGLITDPNLFVTYAVAERLTSELEAGTYFLSNNMPITEIATRLTDSNSSRLDLRVWEGWRIEEIAEAIDGNSRFTFTGADFLQTVGPNADIPPAFVDYVGLPDGASLEGFLYPDDYVLPPSITAAGLRDTLLTRFRENVTTELATDAAAQGLTLYEAVTIASIAQREAVHAEEYPLITSVYRNRLADGMKLDADPTIQYALGQSGQWWSNITRDDYTNVNSPYNTYLYTGLPPGPIANPSLDAIQAAITPQETDYMYFRAFCDESGYHEFAETYEQHLLNGCTG